MLHGAFFLASRTHTINVLIKENVCFGVDGYATMPSASIQDICLVQGRLLVNISIVIFVVGT
jgi:hypothetical protein